MKMPGAVTHQQDELEYSMRRGRYNHSNRGGGGRGGSRGRTMTPKADPNKSRSQSRHTLKISEKLAGIGMEDQTDSDELSYRQERDRAVDRRFVKVVNTLEPSQGSVSGFTRKTKLTGKVRSAYQSVISFSNKLDNENEMQ